MKIKKNGKSINLTESDIKKLSGMISEQGTNKALGQNVQEINKKMDIIITLLSQLPTAELFQNVIEKNYRYDW